MTVESPERFTNQLRIALVVAFLVGIGYYVTKSIHWPLMCDSPIMHYVNFLMQHGKQPYQTITDNNMPGAYLIEGWAMRIFGAGDLGGRFYDYFLLVVIAACMTEIARRKDWVAGFYGGCFFCLLHGSEGPVAASEREQAIMALFMLGYVLLFAAIRTRKPVLMLPFGIVSGFATTIKPTSLLLSFALVVIAAYVLRRRGVALGSYAAWAIAGFAIPILVCFAFLMRHHAVESFWFVLHTITPAYVALAHPSFPDMLRLALPKDVRWFVIFIGIPAAYFNRRWDWERWALTVGSAAGLVSFFVQQKGFNHHRYTFEAILLFLVGMDLMAGMKRKGWPRVVAVTGVLITIFYFIPSYVYRMHTTADNSVMTLALESDLTKLGGDRLQDKVLCFDMVYGCLDALYHLHLVENTGYTGDLLLFFPQEGRASTYYRNMFWQDESRDPADVFVVTNEWLQLPNTFNKINTWPEFVTYLNANYTLVSTRTFPMEGRLTPPPPLGPKDNAYRAYRIYIRKGSSLLNSGTQNLIGN